MDNQHTQITGYRDLSAEEIALMNRIKALGQDTEHLINEIKQGTSNGIACDQRWAAIAATQLQQGLMALTRAVAKPTSF